MRIQIRIRGIEGSTGLRAGMEQDIERLHGLLQVHEAKLVLERLPDRAPSFRAHVHLVVPGPGIHAAARDHTFEATWRKVVRNLCEQIERRKLGHQLQQGNHGQRPLAPRRWSGRLVQAGG